MKSFANNFTLDSEKNNKLSTILKEIGIPEHLICLLRNLYRVKKQQLELDMEQQTGTKLRKEYEKVVYCHPAYLTYMQSTSWEMLGWRKHKLESRRLREVSASDMQMIIILMTEGEEKLKSLLGRRKEESEKSGLKLNFQDKDHGIWCHRFIANRWGSSGNSDRLYFLGLQNHCGWWLQPWNLKMFAPWKKSYDQLRQYIKMKRHYFANKGPSSQSYGFSSSHIWMWELDHKENWATKNWCFYIVVLFKILDSPWTARGSN